MIKCLKLLKISNASKSACELDTNLRYNFDLRKFFNNMGDDVQTGGSFITLKTDGTEFLFDKVDNGDSYMFTLYQNNYVKKNPECIVVMVDKKDGTSAIQSLYHDKKCLTLDNEKFFHNRGKTLLYVALKILQKMKVHFNLKTVQLTDNSYKICNTDNKSINLWALSTLTSGDTWYGKHKFVPIKQEDIDKYLYNKKIMNTVLVNYTNVMSLIENSAVKLGYTAMYKNINKMKKDFGNDKLKDFLTTFLKDYEDTCEIFVNIYDDIIINIGLKNMYGVPYIKNL